VVNGEMSLRRLKLSIYEVVTPREEEEEEELAARIEKETSKQFYSKNLKRRYNVCDLLLVVDVRMILKRILREYT
jgi:hypothetical protein